MLSDIDVLTLTPQEVKAMSFQELAITADAIRTFIIETTSKTGGHVGANTGVVELFIALHYVFASPHDKFIIDTGHIGYAHRIITGRAEHFSTLNTFGGMSRFLARSNSPHDIMDASHAGTALSTAIGLAQAMRMQHDPHRVIAVVGDGAMGEGETWEALNYLAGTDLPVIVVVNDNGLSIPRTVGALSRICGGPERDSYWKARDFFQEGLGIEYFGRCDGHDIKDLISRFSGLCQPPWTECPTILHVKTEKGHGLPCAASHQYKMHFSMPFDPVTGAGASSTIAGRTYATGAAETLTNLMASDNDIVVLTPGTPYASGLESLFAQYPERVLDVGMAEQHAVSMAAGLAVGGKKSVVCMQSTFMQRAYDQIVHDVCYMDLPVTFLCVRSGFAGFDSPTHHGLYDIPILTSFPNLRVHYAMDTQDLTEVLTQQLGTPTGPLALLMPYEPIVTPEPSLGERHDGWAQVCEGDVGTLFCLGNTLQTALAVRTLMATTHQEQYGIICVGALSSSTSLRSVGTQLCPHYVTIEEGAGGFGTVLRRVFDGPYVSWLHCDTRGLFVPAGSKDECATWAQLAPQQIVERIVARWGTPIPRAQLLHAGQST